MKLATGTRLGPYEIQQPVGSGGMGIVYRADDARLGRKVAIKILPNADTEHLKRFEREARLIGGLNHPNLLTLHDIGDFDGTPFIVTELLEGEPLSAKLASGKLRLREAIQIGAEVARGLAAAHEAGVVHRDIKPANIFLTTTGRTKILDFGIAKLMRITEPEPAAPADLGTAATATTDTGQMIGTPGYMAPEQLDGDKVDARADIFALGVVLYEMVSGTRAFASPSPIEESYAILKHTPPPPQGATKALARVIMRCLEKRPEERFQSANDLAFALDELDASTDPIERISKSVLLDEPASKGRAPTRIHPLWIGLGGVACLAVGLTLGGLLPRRSQARREWTRWPSLVEGGPTYQRVTYHSEAPWNARLMRDGKSAVWSRYRNGKSEVMRSLVGQPSIVPLHVEGRLLDVSVRGELAVVNEAVPEEGGTLSRVMEGAGPRALSDNVNAAAWLPDGDSLVIVRDGTTIEFPIGTPIVKKTTGWIDMLRVSPQGDRIAYLDHPAKGDTAGQLVVIDLRGKEISHSTPQTGIEGLAWSPDGTEAWLSNSATIYGVDMQKRERVVLHGGTSRLVLLDVVGSSILVAPTDLRLKMFTGPRTGPFREVSWFDSSDVESMSSDGSAIAFYEDAGTGMTAEGYAHFFRRGDQPPTLLTHGYHMALVPDGSAALVIANPKKLARVPTGIGTAVSLELGPIQELDIGDFVALAWKGRYGVVRGNDASGTSKLWRVDLDNPRQPPQLVPANAQSGRHPISPDGSLVAVPRDAGGIDVVSMTGAPAITIEGIAGDSPVSFTGDGTAIFVSHVVDTTTIQIDRIELATKARSPWLSISPEQPPVYYTLALDAAGEHVTYSTNSDASDLYVLQPPTKP